VCVLSDMKSEVSFLYGYRNLGDDDIDRYKIVHDGTIFPGIFFCPVGGRTPKGSGPKFRLFNCEYLENGKSQCYISIRA